MICRWTSAVNSRLFPTVGFQIITERGSTADSPCRGRTLDPTRGKTYASPGGIQHVSSAGKFQGAHLSVFRLRAARRVGARNSFRRPRRESTLLRNEFRAPKKLRCAQFQVRFVPADQVRGRSCGNRITSRMLSWPRSIMHNRSIPTPMPPAGGIPCSRATRKSSSSFCCSPPA